MAKEILNDFLNSKIKSKNLIGWLVTNNPSSVEWTEFNNRCQREEFVTSFLGSLRDQLNSISQTNLPQPVSTVASTGTKVEDSCNLKEADNKQKNIATTLVQEEEQLKISNLKQDVKGILHSSRTENSSTQGHCHPKTLQSRQEKETINVAPAIDLNVSRSADSSMSKQRNPPKKRVELSRCSPSQSQSFNPAFKESFEHERFNQANRSAISFDANSFPSLGGNSLGNLSNQNLSPDQTVSSFNDSKLSQNSNNLVSCQVPQSPVSPLYSGSISALSPIHSGNSQNRFESPRSSNYSYLNNTSTPERSSRNTSRHSKTTPRQNLSLGDFIVIEQKSSKKSSGKKNCRVLSRGEDQSDTSDHSKLSDSSSQSQQNVRTRKVNPTRLIEDGKGNKENAVFSTASRPFTQNPQFVNVPAIDKSNDNTSFEVERGLIKIERQKKTETDCSESTKEDDMKNQSKLKHLLTPSKVNKVTSITIPNEKLVDRVNFLDRLVELYCGLLDQNLVANPMTEMYAIIHLITTQYVHNGRERISDTEMLTEDAASYNPELDKDRSTTNKSLPTLRRLLNFDDEAEKGIGDLDLPKNHYHSEKPLSKSAESSLADEKSISFDQMHDEMKEICLSDVRVGPTKLSGCETNQSVLEVEDHLRVYLSTPHNCVYFSSKVLNHQKDFLSCLDKVTLKLLSKNNLIARFQPDLVKYLEEIYETKAIQASKRKAPMSIGATELNVCFQTDTDNRENFPSTMAFQCFRKQRDLFYDVLKFWEDKHLNPTPTFHATMSAKIRSIFTVHADITNFTHFARLFKSQLLISCIQMKQQEDVLDDETADFLKNLKDINPEKLMQLTKKLVTPSSQNGPVPLPSFPGIQEFFKDFIFCASNHIFYTFLKDTLICEIIELNNSQFTGSDIEDIGTEVDECTKESFIVCLSSLKLLSKFLGLVTSLPYRSETSALEEVINSQVALRSMCLPPLDLMHCLQFAMAQGKLLLAIPWIVEYLAMKDHASLRLPYNAKVLEILYYIYRASNNQVAINSEKLFTQTGSFLIKLTIGWLFQLPTFPVQLYHTWQSRYNIEVLRIFCDTQQLHEISQCELMDAETSVVSIKHSLSLDKLDIVDDRVLYSCCPFLKELNILLTHGNPNVNSSTSYRHVTPVTSQLKKPIKISSARHLELQLEEAFFHGQPASTRKTVEYVSERVASSCVKHIYNSLLPEEKQKSFELLKDIVKKRCEDPAKDKSMLKNELSGELKSLSMKAAKNVKEKSAEVIPKMCESRVSQAMESLLAEDCMEAVKKVCKEIATRTALERISQWIQSHIVEGTLFVKDMELEITRNQKSNNDIIVDRKLHNPDAPSPTSILDDLRKYMWDLMETRGSKITSDQLSKFWDDTYQSLTERSDLKRLPEKTISCLSVDFCLFLITYRYDLFTPEVQSKVFRVWKIDRLEMSGPESSLSRILCPRNIKLMSQPADENVWTNCGRFLKRCLKENILTIDSLSSQAVALFRNEWPINISKNLSKCLSEAIDGFQSADEETERIRYLLGWVAGACNDMDQEGFNFC